MAGRYRWTLIAIDAIVIALAILLAIELREWVPLPLLASETERILPAIPWIGLLWLLTLAIGGAYRARRWGVGILEYRQVLHLSVLFIMGLGLLSFLLEYPLSRGLLVFLLVPGVPLLLLARITARRLLQRARDAGRFCTPTLVAGNMDAAEDLVQVLQRERWLGYRPVGIAVNGEEPREPTRGVPVVGHYTEILEAIDTSGAHAVIFASGAVNRGQDFNDMARRLELHEAEMIVVPALSDISSNRIKVTPVAGLPLMHVGKPQGQRSLRMSKRLFDLLGSTALIILNLPLLAIVALLVKREDGGPVFFRQVRVGRGGAPFEMIKFRSMVLNAEKIRAEQLEAANESDGPLFKMKDDPRITRVGKVLRRYSVDEVPQLFNVFKGEMSLVGPRPALPKEVAEYDPRMRHRLDVRPGMTGLWQVSGRSNLSWEDTVRLDLYYVDNWSLLQDLAILLRTARAVFGSDGAY